MHRERESTWKESIVIKVSKVEGGSRDRVTVPLEARLMTAVVEKMDRLFVSKLRLFPYRWVMCFTIHKGQLQPEEEMGGGSLVGEGLEDVKKVEKVEG